MSDSKERTIARLENLEAISPLLNSLRVLSLSTLQMAHNRQEALKTYSDQFHLMAAQLNQVVEPEKLVIKEEETYSYAAQAKEKDALVVLGSSRGICGQYNKRLAQRAREIWETDPENCLVIAFGARLHKALHQEGVPFQHQEALMEGSSPKYELVSEQVRAWTELVNGAIWKNIQVLSFRREGGTNNYKPVLSPLLPAPEQALAVKSADELPWPPPIIEGYPAVLLSRIREHLNVIHFYDLILDAIAAESLYRYRLLEEARENTDQLVEELAQAIQIERRKEITQQLQELLSGSGMLLER